MKVIHLVTENYKFIKAIDLTPDEFLQYISGDNEQGKTSLLDSLWAALGGKAGSKDTDQPIRKGQNNAKIFVDLGDLRVTRRFTASGSTLEVTTKDGAKYPSPQAILDNMIGQLSFDPLAFTRLPEKEQKATLQQLLGLNFDAADAKRKVIYDKRTLQNNTTKLHEGSLINMALPAADVPTEEVNVLQIMDEYKDANNQLSLNNVSREGLSNLGEQHEAMLTKIEEAKEALALLEASAANLQTRIAKGAAHILTLVDPDLQEIQERLKTAEVTNRLIRQAQAYRETESWVLESKAAAEQLTKEINEIDAAKELQLKAAKFPVEGLGFDDNGVIINDIPFKQCSTTARMKVSMAMAMAMNPKLRVIRIMDGSLIGEANMKIIYDMAKENDFQVWMEVVDTTGKMGVTIEDGMIKAAVQEG